MTEMSIARSVADFVCEQLPPVDDRPRAVSRIRLRIGVSCGVSAQALKSAFRHVVVGTNLDHAAVEIETVDLVVWCPHCHQEQLLEDAKTLRCPVCQTKTPHIVQGNEFEIVAVEMAEIDQPPIVETSTAR